MSHLAYGLILDSAIPLPELPERDATPDVTVRTVDRVEAEGCDWFHDVADHEGEPWLRSGRTAEGFVLRFLDQIDVAIDAAGTRVSLAADASLDEREIRRLLLDHVLPRLLNLRGVEALHATAVDSPEGVLAFLGATGTGKSTLAYSLYRAGWAPMADDCLALELDGGGVMAIPGYPVFRLHDDVSEALRLDGGDDGGGNKLRVVPASDDRVTEPRPLRRIYRLDRAPEADAPIRVERLAGAEALMALTSQAFRLDIGDRTMLERQMRRLTEVAERVPIATLRYPTSLDALGAVHEVLRADIVQGRGEDRMAGPGQTRDEARRG